MSGYAYNYSLTPVRSGSGWRSVLTGFLTIVAVVAVSTISGAVVTLELIAPSPQRVAEKRAHTVQATASVSQQTVSRQTIQRQAPQIAPAVATPKVASREAPRLRENVDAAAPAQNQQVQAQTPAQPPAPASTTVAASAAPVASPPAAPAYAMADARETVADSELTFSKGYARRRATQRGAAAATAGNARLADVGVAAGQVGRTDVKVVKLKPRTQAVAQDPRRPDAAWSANRFDFDRHQALAFGDGARQRRAPSGAFGGFFDRLF